MSTKHKSLSDEIRKRIQGQDQSIDRVARQIDVRPSTLRAWLHRNTFPKQHLEELWSTITNEPLTLSPQEGRSWEATTGTAQYGFTIAQKRRSHERMGQLLDQQQGERVAVNSIFFSLLEDKARKLEARCPEYWEDLNLIFSAIGKDEIFMHCSATEMPLEWRISDGFRRLGRVIANAVVRGAYFIYFVPSDAVREGRSRSEAWVIPSKMQFRHRFDCFLNRLEMVLTEINPEVTRPTIQSQVLLLEWHSTLFLDPEIRYELVIPHKGYSRALFTHPCGQGLVHLPLPQNVTETIFGLACNSIKQALTRKGASTHFSEEVKSTLKSRLFIT